MSQMSQFDVFFVTRDRWLALGFMVKMKADLSPVPPLPIRRVRSLRRAPTPWGGHHPSCSKKTKNWFLHPRPRPFTPHVCGGTQIIIIDGQLCLWKDIRNPAPRKKNKKGWKRSPCVTNHNPVKLFWVLRLITCLNVGNNFTTTNASNIFSEFPCSLIRKPWF